MYVYRFPDEGKQFFWNLKLRVSCRFIDNLQPTNFNVKFLQRCCIFLKSLNLTCTKVKKWKHTSTWETIPGNSLNSTSRMRQAPWFQFLICENMPRLKTNHTERNLLICFANQFIDSYIAQSPTRSYLRIYFSMEVIKTPKRTPRRTPKSFHKHYSLIGNNLHHIQTGPQPRKASQWIGFNTTQVHNESYHLTDKSIVITPRLLCRLYFWFSISLWYHNSSSCICYYV